MSNDAHDAVRTKVAAIFQELAGDRSVTLNGSILPAGITSTITGALAGPGATEAEMLHADQIAFHLTDWNYDAAFLVALHLYPERFTAEEIQAGVGLFLCHVPYHVIEAARLTGHAAEDFLEGDSDWG